MGGTWRWLFRISVPPFLIISTISFSRRSDLSGRSKLWFERENVQTYDALLNIVKMRKQSHAMNTTFFYFCRLEISVGGSWTISGDVPMQMATGTMFHRTLTPRCARLLCGVRVLSVNCTRSNGARCRLYSVQCTLYAFVHAFFFCYAKLYMYTVGTRNGSVPMHKTWTKRHFFFVFLDFCFAAFSWKFA